MQVFSSKFGRGVSALLWAVLSLSLVQTALESGFWSVVSVLPATLLIGFVAWLVFFNPRVEFSDDSILIINVLATHEIPFSAIQRVDTRWALEVFTQGKKYSAWGAVAPGRHTALFASKDQGEHLPETSYLAGTVRPGDLINTDSGAAAAYLRRKLERVEYQGGAGTSRLHKTSLLVLLLLTLLTAVTL